MIKFTIAACWFHSKISNGDKKEYSSDSYVVTVTGHYYGVTIDGHKCCLSPLLEVDLSQLFKCSLLSIHATNS